MNTQTQQQATRTGFGKGLLAAAQSDPTIVALCADLSDSTKMSAFKDAFPERFFEIGVAEQNMAAVASGLAHEGYMPVIASYAMFSPGRNWEQIRTTIAYNNVPVLIAGHHAGLSVGPDGGSHQALEDIALMRVIPHMRVVVPCDAPEAEVLTKLLLQKKEYAYLRLTRHDSPIIGPEGVSYSLDSNVVVYQSHEHVDVLICAIGPLVDEACKAAKLLEEAGMCVGVLNARILKPFPVEQFKEIIAQLGVTHVCTVEDHQKEGGLNSLIAEVCMEYDIPIKLLRCSVDNQFGQSGTVQELYKAYKLDSESIASYIEEKLTL